MDTTIKAFTDLLHLLEDWKTDCVELLKEEPGACVGILREYNTIKNRISLEVNNRRLTLLRAQSRKLKAEVFPEGAALIKEKDMPALSPADAIEAITTILKRLEDQAVSKQPTDKSKDEILRRSAILGSDPLH
jgi:hypothetical protein